MAEDQSKILSPLLLNEKKKNSLLLPDTGLSTIVKGESLPLHISAGFGFQFEET